MIVAVSQLVETDYGPECEVEFYDMGDVFGKLNPPKLIYTMSEAADSRMIVGWFRRDWPYHGNIEIVSKETWDARAKQNLGPLQEGQAPPFAG